MDTKQYKNRIAQIRHDINHIYRTLSPEKVLIFSLLIITSILFFFAAVVTFNRRFLITVPAYGGVIREGIVGTPRFINPVLATSEQDKDMTALVFAGLTKHDESGVIVPDMAESITESEDGLRYNVTIKHDATFHDGESVTADDIIYTINLIQNPLLKSPHRVEWEGVSVEKNADREVTFILKKPFPLFMNILSIGILPKHIWKNLNEDQISLSDFNIHAIGSGPYAINDIVTESGIPTVFTLASHKHYTLGRPYIETVIISTYQNEKYLLKAFDDRDIDRMHGISPEKVNTLGIATTSIKTSLLPRTFAVFFNPNKLSPLADKNVREALQLAINKQAIVDSVLFKYGKVINTPYPFDSDDTQSEYNPEKAKELLAKSKAINNASSTLDITLATANTDEMKKVAEMIKADWEKIGVTASISIYDMSDLNQNVIKERDFQALLFGAITETPSDLYAFWHSSQRTYPGLNISNYVSKTLDENLELLRSSNDTQERKSAYEAVRQEFTEEVPGIFLFAPSLIYITNDKNISLLPKYSYDNASRFMTIENWYRYTDKVWPKTYYKSLVEVVENSIH
jgi:peptide/nickel transport system substrate-binding protein